MATLLQDIRFSLRMMRSKPGVTLVAIITLALGVGANTAIFGALNGLIFRPLPVANANRLTVLGEHQDGIGDFSQFPYADFNDLRSQTSAFASVMAYEINLAGVDLDGKVEPSVLSFVTGNFFQTLGLKPAVGRVFYGLDTERPGTDPVVVLGYGYWKRRLNGDPSAIGKQLKINGKPALVIGVAPEGFHGVYSLVDTQLYLPLGARALRTANDYEFWTRRDSHDLHVLGLLKPKVSRSQAEAFVGTFAQQLAQQYPETHRGIAYHVYPENLARPDPDPGNGLVLVGAIFMSLAGVVLVLACTNVANIVLVRAAGRTHEMAVRAAIGANRLRIARQLLTESILLGIFGGCAGLAAGAWANHVLGSIRLEFATIPVHFDFGLDWRVCLFGAAVAIITGLLLGLVPAWKVARVDLSATLREGGRGLLGGTPRSRFRDALVIGQISASFLLLVVAGLFVRSTRNVEHVDLGFNSTHVLNITMDTRTVGYDTVRSRQFFSELESRVAALPGVEAASLALSVPMGYSSNSDPVYIEGRAASAQEAAPDILYNAVSPLYFKTMGVLLVSGRVFTAQDNENTPLVAIVNETMARRYWPAQNAIGRRFSVKGPAGPFIQIIGVAKDEKYESPIEAPQAFYFLPRAQHESTFAILQMRTATAPRSLVNDVDQVVHSLAPGLPLVDVQSMDQSLQGVNGFFRFHVGANLAGLLGIIGLVLATVGVYGVISYVAAQRTHEIGVRMALGATRFDILKLLLRRGCILVSAGIVAGLALTLLIARGVASFLVGVGPTDPLTVFLSAMVLTVVGLLASFVPARRAMKVDPLRALKYE